MLNVSDIGEDEIVFYDIETTSVFAPYCKLVMIAYQLGVNGSPELVDPNSKESMEAFRELVGSPDIMKVSFNGINFDDIVLWRYGFYVHPKNRHDMYLALKTIRPTFPSFSLKFVNFALSIEDQTCEEAWHMPEWELESWLIHNGYEKKYMSRAPHKLLADYCKHDVRETVNAFRAIWELVQEDPHWEPYCELELAMGEPLHEMSLLGKEYICLEELEKMIAFYEKQKEEWMEHMRLNSEGRIKNAISTPQIAKYINENPEDFPDIEVTITAKGNPSIRKIDLIGGMIGQKLGAFTQDLSYHGGRGGDTFSVIGAMLEEIQRSNKRASKQSVVTRCAYEARDITKVLGYLRSYYRAGQFEKWRARNGVSNKRKDGEFLPINFGGSIHKLRNKDRIQESKKANNGIDALIAIPKGYYLSAARTRRFRSALKGSYRGEKFGINYQNQTERSKIVQRVPPGWLAWWLDSTSIENIMHIWASDDIERREDYEKHLDWNEYVWLANKVLGGKERSREELEAIKSPENPLWSVYKQYKTIKLAMNFGMGPKKFATTTGLPIRKAEREFNRVHIASPAIKGLQTKVRKAIKEYGYVKDPFGHIYSGNADSAYKIVAYLIQGCGTGSVPKAMTVANYATIHSLDSDSPIYPTFWRHPYTRKYSYGILCGTTHDECAGRLSLGLPTKLIVKLIKELLYNMEQKFEERFDNIPLRAKLTISYKNAAEYKKLDHNKANFKEELVDYIEEAKENYEL